MAHILLIESSRNLAKIYTHAFQHDGHQVTLAATAQGAIQAADEQRPDVVVLELQLPVHNGIEFLYEFRSYADWHAVPVIIHSLVPPAEFRQTNFLRELGIAAYLYKPRTSLHTLLRTVADIIHAPLMVSG